MSKANQKVVKIIRQHIANGNNDAAKRIAESTLRTISTNAKRAEFINAINASA